MPHEFVIGAFEPGDDDMGDFILDRWLPFARDECNWVDNRAPTVGTLPDIECWTHRGTTGSPVSPFVFFRTHDRHLNIFTGTGVNLAEEVYDQPGNPANAPRTTGFDLPASGRIGNTLKTCFVNTIVGPYQGYWLFCDTTGEYIYCVIKVSAREYRHFHIGRLRQIDGGDDIDPQSFFITGHFWEQLGSNAYDFTFSGQGTPVQAESAPYKSNHRIPFRNTFYQDGSFGSMVVNTAPGSRFYIPGFAGHAYDWYHPDEGNALTTTAGAAVKTVGTIGTPTTIGQCITNYYDQGLGAVLFACDRNFTANANVLVPIYVGVQRDFAGDVRLGIAAQVPDIFRINMRDFSPEQTITVSGQDYKVFPVINNDSQNILDSEGYSGWEGLAYRVETGPVV